MKIITLIILLFFGIISMQAQDYQISFEGTGADTIVDTVKVENLTQGKSIELSGSEILHLIGTSTEINTVPDIENTLRMYPNPMYGNSTIDFVAVASGIVTIELYNISGKRIATAQNRLLIGNHSYQVSGLRNGIYIIRISSQAYSYIGKLVSYGVSGLDVKISYIGNSVMPDKAKMLKSASAEKLMQYNNGDRLKFTGTSGNYRTIITDIPKQSKTITFNFVVCIDADGNYYSIVQIGSQIWMAENLKTTKYRNGDLIGTTTPAILDISDQNTPKYQWAFDGNDSITETYGRLYTWYAITDDRKVCPTGWHVPALDDWETLVKNFYGGRANAGGHLKETNITNWLSPNTSATNTSGFTALPGGGRSSNGTFGGIGAGGYWWTSSGGKDDAYSLYMLYDKRSATQYFGGKKHGYSVRCLQDENATNIALNTTTVSSITTKSAISGGGNIRSLGDATVIARGVCWNTTGNPTIADSKTTEGSSTEKFTSSITNLTPNTTYFVRAYATNSVGTGYGETISFKTYTDTITDIEGNVYYTVTIGNQVWIAENLKTTKYNDGTNIPNVIDNTAWANHTTPGYCLYNNDITNNNTYGVLYNWHAVNTGKLCPTGWHVPTYAEWTIMINYLGGENVAGNKLKESGTAHWKSPSSGATNESSFTALSGGGRDSDGTFFGFGTDGNWWCSGENNVGDVSVKSMFYGNSLVSGGFDKKESGFSVRCVKDF